jgi:hypothetical protein
VLEAVKLFHWAARLYGPGRPEFRHRVMVTPETAIPPALDLIVTRSGGGTLVNRMVNTPSANGITGPITPV